MSRKYVVARDTPEGRSYVARLDRNPTWTWRLRCAHRFEGVEYAAAAALHVGAHALVLPLRPKGSPSARAALIARLSEARADAVDFVNRANAYRNERDEARAARDVALDDAVRLRVEVNVLKGERDTWHAEAERLTKERDDASREAASLGHLRDELEALRDPKRVNGMTRAEAIAHARRASIEECIAAFDGWHDQANPAAAIRALLDEPEAPEAPER